MARDKPPIRPAREERADERADAGPLKSVDDAELLDEFCQSFDFDDVDFDTWQKSHHSLDLKIEVNVRKKDLGKPVDVNFVRTIQNGPKKSKAKVTLTVWVPTPSGPPHSLTMADEGDERDGQRGKVIIIFRPID